VTFTRSVAVALAATLLALAPGARPVLAQDCDTLPTSAQRPRACNPREECLQRIPKDLSGAAREATAKECGRQPTSGICYGPDTYNPQTECRQKKK
jgi:hypothetical protein